MSDKKNIEKVLSLLEVFKGQIDEQITNYKSAELNFEAAEIEGNTADMSTNQKAMEVARDAIISKLAAIDKLIFEQSEGKVTESLGVKNPTDATVKDLNSKIAEILERVKSAKDLGMKTDAGKDVEVKFKTADTLERLDELDATKKTRDYSKIDQDIADLEAKVVDEEQYKKFTEIKGKIAKRDKIDEKDVDVRDDYTTFTSDFSKKLDEYKKLKALKEFNGKNFKQIQTKTTLAGNKAKVEELLKKLKDARSGEMITVGGKPLKIGGKDASVKDLTFDELMKLDNKTLKSVMGTLSKLCTVDDKELKSKADELKGIADASISLELFAEDKAAIEAALSATPVDLAKLDALQQQMIDIDGKNNEVLTKMEEYNSAEVVKARKELDHLKKVKAAMDKEAGIKVEAEEISKLKFGKDGKTEVEIKRKPGGYEGKFVDAKDDDLEEVVEATYKGLDRKVREGFEKSVIRDAEKGDKLPRHIPLFSKLAAAFRGETMTTREKAIAARVKKKISQKIVEEQNVSKGSAAAVETSEKQKAETEKNDLFRVDKETIDRIDAAARKFIIDQQGQTTVEQAREQAARDEEK